MSGGFVRDERPHLLRVLGHQSQRVHRAAAAGEDVDRPSIDRGDEPMQVVGVLLDHVLHRPSVRVLRSDPRGS
jgi:hypothetical protein